MSNLLKWHTPQNSFNTIDADRCIFEWTPWCETAFWVFSRAHPGNNIKEEASELFQHYYKIEMDIHISGAEKLEHMKVWNKLALAILWKYINEDQFEKTLEYARKNLRIRGWMQKYFQDSYNLWIPTIVFSAWVSNVIEAVLEANEMPYTTVHSNKLGFVDGKLQLLNEGVYIWNKGWISLPEELRKSVSQRTHQLVIWDSIDDIHMWDPDRIRSNIWFLNSEQIEKWNRDKYKRLFDHVEESDTSDNWLLLELIRELAMAV